MAQHPSASAWFHNDRGAGQDPGRGTALVDKHLATSSTGAKPGEWTSGLGSAKPIACDA